MKRIFQKMMRDQVQLDLENPAELIKKPVPKGGWLRIVRNILGMSGQQLARKLGCAPSNVTAFERREREGTMSLETLEKVATAMNCRLVYFLVPNKPFDVLLEEQAHRVAQQRLRTIGHSMKLENQGLSHAQNKQQENELVEELLQGNLRKLWEAEDEI